MDLNDLRVLTTLLSFAAFVGIAVWAWRDRRRGAFSQAERLPFDAEEGGRE